MAKAIEPTLDADRDDRKVANYGGVNPFSPGAPRGYMGLRENLLDPHPPGSLSGRVIPSLNFAYIREVVQAVSRQFLADQEEFFLDLAGGAGDDVSL